MKMVKSTTVFLYCIFPAFCAAAQQPVKQPVLKKQPSMNLTRQEAYFAQKEKNATCGEKCCRIFNLCRAIKGIVKHKKALPEIEALSNMSSVDLTKRNAVEARQGRTMRCAAACYRGCSCCWHVMCCNCSNYHCVCCWYSCCEDPEPIPTGMDGLVESHGPEDMAMDDESSHLKKAARRQSQRRATQSQKGGMRHLSLPLHALADLTKLNQEKGNQLEDKEKGSRPRAHTHTPPSETASTTPPTGSAPGSPLLSQTRNSHMQSPTPSFASASGSVGLRQAVEATLPGEVNQ